MKAFQFLFILRPTTEEAEKGVQAKLLSDVRTILAVDEKQAAMLAGREIPEEHLDKMARLEVALRPF